MFVVELTNGCWFAPWNGAPGRTVVLDNARVFYSKRGAKVVMNRVIRRYSAYRSFKEAKVIPISIVQQSLVAIANENGDRCVCDKCGQPHNPKLVSGGPAKDNREKCPECDGEMEQEYMCAECGYYHGVEG